MEYYLIYQSLHLIFMVSWFAGLFYIVRLFIYHTEALHGAENERAILHPQYSIMERRLFWVITTPAMVLTLVFGLSMLAVNPILLEQPWMHIKLTFVGVLLLYHFQCQRLMFRLAKGITSWTSKQLRLFNELATLVLVSVVFLAVTKGTISWWKATLAFFSVAVGLMLLIKLYRRFTR